MNYLIKVFTDNYKLLFRIVYAYVGDIEDTKDILQETFIRAFKARREDIPSNELLPWLIVIAKNASKTHIKKKAESPIALGGSFDAAYEPDFLGFTLQESLEELITIVPQDLREIIRLHTTENTSLKKLAYEHKAVYSRLRYWNKVFIKAVKAIINE